MYNTSNQEMVRPGSFVIPIENINSLANSDTIEATGEAAGNYAQYQVRLQAAVELLSALFPSQEHKPAVWLLQDSSGSLVQWNPVIRVTLGPEILTLITG